MSRRLAVRLVLLVLGLAGFYFLWCFAYELVVAARWNPALPGEGADRFALLKYQNREMSFQALTIAPAHLLERLGHPATQLEALIRAAIAAAAVILAGIALVIFGYAVRKPAPYGLSRFGNLMEAEGKGLTAKKGLILGKIGSTPIVSDEPAHVLVVGPTRSGKGVSFIVPNGFTWQGSSVWFDPKRENFSIFGAYRKSIGEDVFMFSPGERETHRYNPLDFIRRDERMPTDAMVVASFIIPDATGSGEIWAKSARMLLASMIGYVMTASSCEGERHLRRVSRMTTTGVDFLLVLKGLVENQGHLMPSWVKDGFNQFIGIEKETRNSALFNLNTAMNPWNSGLIAAATETSDFDIRQLRRRRMSIFIGCSIAQLDIYRPIIKILVQQIHDQMMASLPGPDEPHQVLVMIDEFRQLGPMESLVSKLTVNAGYGFRMVLVLQDVGQLDEVYSKAVRITTLSACQVKLFIQINDLETAEYVSDMLGQTTLEIKTPVHRAGQTIFSTEKSVRYEERAFKTPEDLRRMKPTKAILLVPNSYGFELTKYRYFADSPFKKMLAKIARVKVKLPALAEWSDDGLLKTPASEPAQQVQIKSIEEQKQERIAEHERLNAEVYRERREVMASNGGGEQAKLSKVNTATSPAPDAATEPDIAVPKPAEAPKKPKGAKIKVSASPPLDRAAIDDMSVGGLFDLLACETHTTEAVTASNSDQKRTADRGSRSVDGFISTVDEALSN